MWRSLTILLAVVAIMLLGCGKETEPEKVVATTAKLYYDYLLDGRYDDYVAGIDGADSLPGSYKEQLRDNIKMFMARQRQLHKGISTFNIVNAEIDADSHTANAFFVVNYADSTSEQIVVPLVERGGVWRMR